MGQFKNLGLSIGASLLLSACAGPSSPFGGINTVEPQEAQVREKYEQPSMDTEPEEVVVKSIEPHETESNIPKYLKEPSIEFFPDRQYLHDIKDWKVTIHGVRESEPYRHIRVFYNGIDVTRNFLSRAYASQTNDSYELVFKDLKLPFDRYNRIHVIYNRTDGKQLNSTYLPPTCSIYDEWEIGNLLPFSPPQSYLKAINKHARREQVNPSFVAGIVAQESAFNPKAVSWAKAIGLTQVTPLAEADIIDRHKNFPRYPALNKYSWTRIKYKILSGEVNRNNEWRVNPYYSIQGGLTYLKYVDRFWRKAKNAEVLRRLKGDPYIVYSQIVLASYNSGPSRVKRAILRNGNNWLLDHELSEAHKYVNRIFSYCYHFADQQTEGDSENPS